MAQITKEMTIGQVLKLDERLVEALMRVGMHCLGCPASQIETLEEAAMVHGFNVDDLVAELNKAIAK